MELNGFLHASADNADRGFCGLCVGMAGQRDRQQEPQGCGIELCSLARWN